MAVETITRKLSFPKLNKPGPRSAEVFCSRHCRGVKYLTATTKQSESKIKAKRKQCKETIFAVFKTPSASQRKLFLFTWKNQKRTGRLPFSLGYLLRTVPTTQTLPDTSKEAFKWSSKTFAASQRELFSREVEIFIVAPHSLDNSFYLSGWKAIQLPELSEKRAKTARNGAKSPQK